MITTIGKLRLSGMRQQQRVNRFRLLALIGLISTLQTGELFAPLSAKEPEASAAIRHGISFLATEVDSWEPSNHCYSCHNHGDAARALYDAIGLGFKVPPERMLQTNRWLREPMGWGMNGPDGEFNDRDLANSHFATALVAAVQAGQIADRTPLASAAELLASQQHGDGSWRLSPQETIGSPITHGTVLLTVEAIEALGVADSERFRHQRKKGKDWLLRRRPRSVLDAAALLTALDEDGEKKTSELEEHCLELIRQGQASDGGWGPFVNSAPEVFDTAVVVLALGQHGHRAHGNIIRRGRDFLIKSQFEDGSWPATTRPPNRESYAHRVSTSAWALRALIASLQTSEDE